MEYIHNNNILFRDLKPENLVFDSRGYLRITDFGIAKRYEVNNKKDTSGTVGYLAPEILCNVNHGFSIDYYSIGIITYELIFGNRPYIGKSKHEVKQLILTKQAHVDYDDLPGKFDVNVCDFINKLIQRKPKNRLGKNSIKELIEHPWFDKFDWENVRKKIPNAPYIPKPGDNFDRRYCLAKEKIGNETLERYKKIISSEDYENKFVNFNSKIIPEELIGKKNKSKINDNGNNNSNLSTSSLSRNKNDMKSAHKNTNISMNNQYSVLSFDKNTENKNEINNNNNKYHKINNYKNNSVLNKFNNNKNSNEIFNSIKHSKNKSYSYSNYFNNNNNNINNNNNNNNNNKNNMSFNGTFYNKINSTTYLLKGNNNNIKRQFTPNYTKSNSERKLLSSHSVQSLKHIKNMLNNNNNFINNSIYQYNYMDNNNNNNFIGFINNNYNPFNESNLFSNKFKLKSKLVLNKKLPIINLSLNQKKINNEIHNNILFNQFNNNIGKLSERIFFNKKKKSNNNINNKLFNNSFDRNNSFKNSFYNYSKKNTINLSNNKNLNNSANKSSYSYFK